MKVYSDKFSEKYRKYIIKVTFSSKEFYYLLWGTNLQNEDLDYIMLNQTNQILAFSKLNGLLDYVNSNEVLIDSKSTKEWVENYRNRKPYFTYAIDKIYEILKIEFILSSISREDASCIIYFYNLFSDYAYQVNNNLFLKIIKEKNIVNLSDFFHAKYFWNTNGQEMKLEKMDKKFDFLKFRNTYLEMLSFFKDQLLIYK